VDNSAKDALSLTDDRLNATDAAASSAPKESEISEEEHAKYAAARRDERRSSAPVSVDAKCFVPRKISLTGR
jgi:hypothetical protein